MRAYSIFSQLPALREAKISELMAIWDYKGKLESRGWSQEQSLCILEACLLSPPGKMLRCFGQAVCNAILLKLHNCFEEPPEVEVRAPSRGLMADIPFSPLKEKATPRVAAAQADDVEVVLLAWSSPSETGQGPSEGHAKAFCSPMVGI